MCSLEVEIGQRKSNYISQVPSSPINACRGQKQPDKYGEILEAKAYLGKDLKEKCSSEHY